MRTNIVLILVMVLAGACSKSPPTTTGIAKWDAVSSLAEAFVLHGDSRAILNHTDLGGVPPSAAQTLKAFFDDWHGIPGNLKLTSTQVMTFDEFEVLQKDDKKDLPEDMRNMPSSIRWNIRPEKMIVFTFASKDPKDTTTKVRWSAGTYHTNGLWYFAASYTP